MFPPIWRDYSLCTWVWVVAQWIWILSYLTGWIKASKVETMLGSAVGKCWKARRQWWSEQHRATPFPLFSMFRLESLRIDPRREG